MPPIVRGQTFSSLQAFKTALRDWAIERNWTPHILDSDSHRVRAGCRSGPNCPFRIRANYSTKRGDAKVTTCDDTHTCEPFRANPENRTHQPIKRAETGKLKFLLDVVPRLMTVTLDTNVAEIIDLIELKYGQKIPTRQAQKVKASLTDRVKGPCRHCHQLGHTRRQCPQLQAPPATAGPMAFPSLVHEAPPLTAGSGDDATYADGGLEIPHENDRILDRSIHLGNRRDIAPPPPPPFAPPPHPHQVQGPAEFVTAQQTDIPMDPTLSNVASRRSPRENPLTEQPAIVPHPPSVVESNRNLGQQTPQDTRLEAARLMQQAARLMQEAARLNSEAARLTASAANS